LPAGVPYKQRAPAVEASVGCEQPNTRVLLFNSHRWTRAIAHFGEMKTVSRLPDK